METWILIITFTSFFNGNTTIKTIEGFTNQAACIKAARQFYSVNTRVRCIQVK